MMNNDYNVFATHIQARLWDVQGVLSTLECIGFDIDSLMYVRVL